MTIIITPRKPIKIAQILCTPNFSPRIGTASNAAKIAADHSKTPDKLYTVFAGFHNDATNQVRKYCLPYPPSSPSMALFKDGKLVHFIERHHIEGRPAELIAENLTAAFDEFC